MQNPMRNSNPADTFICHASEDKESIARPLADVMRELGIHAWFDQFEIGLGDSIRRKIDQGLASCRSATVILSRPFFTKNWTQYEMDGIIQRHVQGEIALFPIRHAITIEEIRSHSPSLADIASLSSSEQTIEQIATEIAGRLSRFSRATAVTSPTTTPTATTGTTDRTFGVFHVAPAGTPELPPGSDPEPTLPFLTQEPAGWVPMVNNNEELEYIMDGKTLRLRLDWGNHWAGNEFQAAMMLSRNEPLAFTIRPSQEPQVYLRSVVSQSAIELFTGHRNPSGWMTFLIQ